MVWFKGQPAVCPFKFNRKPHSNHDLGNTSKQNRTQIRLRSMSLSWAWSSGAWYVVDYAKTGRSTCKEFRCRESIKEGELRIGIEAPEDDHRGSQLGWYHPSCLWKTFLVEVFEMELMCMCKVYTYISTQIFLNYSRVVYS